MTINNFKYFPFSLKLTTPFQTSSQTIHERNGFLISMSDEFGNVSLGECSPLPGFSRGTLEDSERILKGLQYQINGFSTEENLNSVSDLLSEFHLVPSLQFALEQAIIMLIIKSNKNFIKEFLRTEKSSVAVNAIIGFGEEENILSSIGEKINKGYGTFKIKIGRDDFDLDFRLIKKVRELFGYNIRIRLDTNQRWHMKNAASYLNQLSQFGIEYIEEPCDNLNCNLQLANKSTIPIALDESIHSTDDAFKVINDSSINFIVLKPMIYGGIISSLQLIKEAGKKNKNVIISSSFESAVGKSALTLLAAVTNHSFAHGLDTSEYFKRDICKDLFEVENGKIFFDSENYPPQFDLVLS